MNDFNYSAGSFGKLPNFADFVKFNSGNNEIVAFDQWLQNGIQKSKLKLAGEFADLYSNADVINFIFPIQNSGNLLAGSFITSNDKSGRHYPFIISVSVQSSMLNGVGYNLLPLLYEKFYRQCKNILTGIKEYDDSKQIADQVQNIQLPHQLDFASRSAHYRDYLNITSMNKLWNRLFNDFDDSRKYLLFYNLSETLLPFRNKDLNTFKLGFKIPVSQEKEFTYANISFWVNLCLQISGQKNSRPYLFWSQSDKTSEQHLVLYFNLPSAEVFTHLINPDYLPDSICRAEKDGDAENSKTALSSQYKNLINQKEITLNTFLNQI